MASARATARGVLAVVYGAAGTLHLVLTSAFLTIVPTWVPLPTLVVRATGVCEILGALALLSRPLRRAAGIALALYAVCVYPANVKHAVDTLADGTLGWWYHAPRLALQPVLVWWALYAGEVLHWPFRRPPISDAQI